MSAQPKYMAQKSIAICEHPPQESIDWKYYQGLANQEFPLSANLEFSEESKNQIVAALDLLRRNVQSSSARVKLGDLKKRASEILAILKDRSNQEVDENLHLVPDLDVFEQILLNAADEGVAGQSYAQRATLFIKLLRVNSSSVTMHLPSGEAMAVHEIHEAFRKSGIKASVRHTRPTTFSEGNEPISAFEQFIFDFVMPNIGSDPAARKTVYRRLREAEKAIQRKF